MQQAFISPASSGTTILRLTKKQNACWDTALAAASPVDIPTGWEPRTKQQQWVAFADFPQCSVVFAAKYRRMVIYGQIKKDIGQILRKLCEQKDIEIIEAEACPDHIHMLISFSPKYSISYVMGYLKGKSSLMIFDRHANLKYKYGNRHFWARGYFVDAKESRLCKRWCRKCAVAFLYKKERQILRFDVQYLVHLQGLEPWAH